ncbi:long-chain fatty acid--CoA ligase [Neisseria arctica]|uniref:Long-chain-fatty-acid--CoA ligase n=1 Tax=Neisseria arctica TaxID=1470200 RepID=A0A0J0YTD6_9NEIS|nr:AMP-binding protein [Neisseria arctica]KLT73371.1 long-chain fatty acid--CoA ligase [Neisseria arctica]UOO87360.1 AMP-binding protein [Neisseria arctica]
MEKVWLQSYQAGVKEEVDIRQFTSIVDAFQKSSTKYANRPAFINMGKSLTYGELAELSGHFASYLQDHLKLTKGDRVAIMMPNLLQYPVALFGALQAGMIVVNVNPLYTPRELEHQLNDSGAQTIVVLENFADTLEMVLPRTQVKNVIVASIGDLLGSFKGWLTNFVVRKVKKMVPNYNLPGSVTFKQAINLGRARPFIPVDITLEDTAFLQYTGGTTGVAKGAVLTHGNICANMAQAKEWISQSLNGDKEVALSALPLYHIFALTVNVMIFMQMGAANLLITNPRDLPALIKEIDKHKITVFIGVNTLFNALINQEAFKSLDFSHWKLALGGGMAVQKAVADKWQAITGVPIVEAYGLTEASPGVAINPLNITAHTGNIGLPISNTEIEIRDDNGQALGIGEAGELWIRGPQVMNGYWNRPDETAKVLDSRGYLATGDIAVVDEKGWIKLVDRKKDMIVVSGFNVYPNEIEDVIAQHPKVLEVACIGVSSEKTGEALKLFVVKKDPSLTEAELIEYARHELTGYKVPKDIEFRNDLPKSNVGKILRRELRDSTPKS